MPETIPEGFPLAGCRPEPLMAYLKALGILRIVGDQKDRSVRGWWDRETFWLRSTLGREALADFFLREYKPTPILVPWSGNDFFNVNWEPDRPHFGKTPTGSKVIEAILATSSGRFGRYRAALSECRVALEECGIGSKEKMGKDKWKLIQFLRSTCAEPSLLDWIDCAAVLTAEKFAPLLGSGGGSDGNTHFSDNFMQNLWDVLPNFDEQRKSQKNERRHAEPSMNQRSRQQLDNTLFGIRTHDLIPKRTSALYDSGAVGGANATQGMERDSLSNPWDMVLAFEGIVSFAGAAVKRFQANARVAAFPFQVKASLTQEGLADREQGGAEIWLPMWNRPASAGEVLALMREGRADYGGQRAKSGLGMARAIATLGVDRGIRAFHRFAIVKGRVGGENYNTAAALGNFPVVDRRDAELLRDLDPWLDSFRRACGGDNVPPRFQAALRTIDQTIFDFCRYGGHTFFQAFIRALGSAERELASGERFRVANRILPISGLSRDWIDAASDETPEFEVALALAGIFDRDRRIGSLRSNVEPVATWYESSGEATASWAGEGRSVVWNSADLYVNLAAVLARRLMDAERSACAHLPLAASNFVSLTTVSRFLIGELNERKIEDLLWGLMLLPQVRGVPRTSAADGGVPPLPRAYALLKLLFLPEAMRVNGMRVTVKAQPSILGRLAAGQVAEACQLAARRLRASGLAPMPHQRIGGAVRDSDWQENDPHLASNRGRLAAALLLPLSDTSVRRLQDLVFHEATAGVRRI